jgi:hypothetical protein
VNFVGSVVCRPGSEMASVGRRKVFFVHVDLGRLSINQTFFIHRVAVCVRELVVHSTFKSALRSLRALRAALLLSLLALCFGLCRR